MTAEKQRWPHAEAMTVACSLMLTLAPHCERIEIVGSLRRMRPTVSDLELLYIPTVATERDPGDMFGAMIEYSPVDRAIARMEAGNLLARRLSKAGHEAYGPKNKLLVHIPSGINIDLFATTEKNWWVSLVVRTGGLETNLKLTKAANERGRSLVAYGEGIRNLATGEVTPADSEEDVFALCGVPFLKPEERP